MAGFVVLGSAGLVTFYVIQVMHYNHEQQGKLEMIAFAGMLGGLAVALFATRNPKRDPQRVIPAGVSIMEQACVLLSGSNAHSSVSDLWFPRLLKGLAIGILNITLTVHILRSFPKQQAVEGTAWFFLFSNLGSMLAITEFSRLMYAETAAATKTLAANSNAGSESLMQHYQLTQKTLENSMLTASPEQSATLLSSQLHTQAMSVAGVNNFQWIIATIALLVPVMVFGAVKWANSRPQHH